MISKEDLEDIDRFAADEDRYKRILDIERFNRKYRAIQQDEYTTKKKGIIKYKKKKKG